MYIYILLYYIILYIMYYILYMHIHKYIYIYRPSSLTRVQNARVPAQILKLQVVKLTDKILGHFNGENRGRFTKTFAEGTWFLQYIYGISWYLNGILMEFNGIYDGYPLVNVYITMERSTSFNGKTHYFYGHCQ